MIYVQDIGRMAAFYESTLGLQPIEATRSESWVEFAAGAARLGLHAIPAEIAERIEMESAQGARREENPVKLSFEVDDLAYEVRRLESLGAAVMRRPWGGCDVIDPEGNVVGLHSPVSSASTGAD